MIAYGDTYKRNKNPTSTHICVIMLLHGVLIVVTCDNMHLITSYVNCCWNIVIDNCMICGLCDLLKRRRHYELCDLLC